MIDRELIIWPKDYGDEDDNGVAVHLGTVREGSAEYWLVVIDPNGSPAAWVAPEDAENLASDPETDPDLAKRIRARICEIHNRMTQPREAETGTKVSKTSDESV